MHEFVVPKSIPRILLIVVVLSNLSDGCLTFPGLDRVRILHLSLCKIHANFTTFLSYILSMIYDFEYDKHVCDNLSQM